MNEYYDYEDEMDGRLAAIEQYLEGGEQLSGDEEDALISAQLSEYQEQIGRELAPEEVQELGDLALEHRDEQGLPNIGGVLDAFDQEERASEAWETSFENGVKRLEQQLGRSLLDKEVDQLRDLLPDETDAELDVPAVWKDTLGKKGDEFDLSTSSGRANAITERFAQKIPQEEPPETVKELPPGASEEERIAYMNARVAGAQAVEGEDASAEA